MNGSRDRRRPRPPKQALGVWTRGYIKDGQIHHVDGDPTSTDPDKLRIVPPRFPVSDTASHARLIQIAEVNKAATVMAGDAITAMPAEIGDRLSEAQTQALYNAVWDAIKEGLDEALWQEIAP